MKNCDVLIIGGGVAGMAAACAMYHKYPGLSVILVEREKQLGGVLSQCIHYGFGMASFGKELTGPEYQRELEKRLRETDVAIMLRTEVLKIVLPPETNKPEVLVFSTGHQDRIRCGRIILATGCYERPIGNLMIAGTRPEGIFGAGELQRMMNLEGYPPNGDAVVIGSGDIGLIVSRRLIKNGVIVKRIVEIQEKSPAMERNQRRCLKEYHLPLQLHSQVIEIHGERELCGVTILDKQTGETEFVRCDMLIVAAGLLPERSLLERLPDHYGEWITLVGNCEKIYPIADAIVNAAEGICDNVKKISK